MTTAGLFALITLLVLGAPYLALRADRRMKPPRRRPSADDVLRELARSHQLSADDVEEVRTAVRLGTAVEPRLRPVVLGYAPTLNPRSRRLASWPRRRQQAFRVAVMVLLVAGLTAVVAYNLARRHFFNAGQVLFWAGIDLVIAVRQHRRAAAARRAITLAQATGVAVDPGQRDSGADFGTTFW